MTVLELYKNALNIMFEKPSSKVYDNYYVDHINIVLANTFETNNTIRLRNGKEKLETIPLIANDNDEIPYEEIMLREVLPYGLAAQFCIDDDLNKYQIYNTCFLNACNKYEKAIVMDIEDYYA